MQSGLSGWMPYILLAALAGTVNVANAWKQLRYDCRFLVFFRPSRVFGVYVWTLAQLILPAIFAWFVLGCSDKPPVSLALAGKTIGVGIGFVALMNATTQVAGFNIDPFRKFYNWVIYAAKDLVAARETARTAAFWQSVKTELAVVGSLDPGFAYLHDYIESDVSLSPEVRAATLAGIDKVAAIPDRTKQVAQVKGVLAVRRRDLSTILQRFGCSDKVISALVN
jgi:hypothetical protein